MKGWGAIWAWILLALLAVEANAVDRSPISAEIRVSQREVTIGDIVTYSIIVRHDARIQVAPPDPTPHFKKGFEYVDQGTTNPITVKGQQEQTFWYKFRADRVGFYNLPEIPVLFTAPAPDDPSQTIPGTLQAPKAEIIIRSVLFIDEQAEDIKDIKPLIGAGLNWPKYLKRIVAGLAVLLIGAGLYWWFLPRKKSPAAAARIPELKPHEIALAGLDQLLARKLLASGRFREHYFELSEIFRRYLGALWSIPALDWTTEEIRDYLSRHRGTDPELQRTVLALLPETDQVKFAKAPVALNTAYRHVDSVREFIRITTPKDQPGIRETAPAEA